MFSQQCRDCSHFMKEEIIKLWLQSRFFPSQGHGQKSAHKRRRQEKCTQGGKFGYRWNLQCYLFFLSTAYDWLFLGAGITFIFFLLPICIPSNFNKLTPTTFVTRKKYNLQKKKRDNHIFIWKAFKHIKLLWVAISRVEETAGWDNLTFSDKWVPNTGNF